MQQDSPEMDDAGQIALISASHACSPLTSPFLDNNDGNVDFQTKKHLKLLIVDDDDVDRNLMCRLINKSNHVFDIDEADSISRATEYLIENRYDCMLLDYRLPDGTGPEKITYFREAANNQYLPIIVLTGNGDEHTAIESFQVGASDYMPKEDMSTSSLFRALNNSMQKASLQQRVAEQRIHMIEANTILKAQNHQICSFYQTVSHELKTPLTGAREYASLVMDGIAGEVNAEQSELLGRAIECCDSLKILVNDLLDAAEFENENLVMRFETINTEKVIEDAISCLSLLPQNRGSKIIFSHEAPLPDIHVDKTRINQVISNIVNNAIKFTEGECCVKIHAQECTIHNDLNIYISDNGPGIPEDASENIFDKFYQIKSSSDINNRGMGLGLFLCRKIIQAHDGHILVESKLGEGSTFILTIPLKPKIS